MPASRFKHFPRAALSRNSSLILGFAAMLLLMRLLAVIGLSQIHFLRDMGCEVIQGYLVSAPGPAENLETLLLRGWRAAA